MNQISASRTAILLAQIDRMIDLLTADCENHWRTHLLEAAAQIRAGNANGVRSFLGGFGTAGSFNECSVGKDRWVDGKHEWLPGEEVKYREFEELKNSSFLLAQEALREADNSGPSSLFGFIRGIPPRTRLLVFLALGALAIAALKP